MREVLSRVVTSAEYAWIGVKWLWKALGYLIAIALLGLMLSPGCASDYYRVKVEHGEPDPFVYPDWLMWPDQVLFEEILVVMGDPAAKERARNR